MKKEKFYSILFSLVLIFALTVKMFANSESQSELDKYEPLIHSFVFNKVSEDLAYRLMRPIHFDAAKKYPVVITLHGAGGFSVPSQVELYNINSLRDCNRQLAKDEVRLNYPAYVICPQANKGDMWSIKHLTGIKQIIAGLPSVDMNRIYVMGQSAGGRGTNNFIVLDPNYFAAAIVASANSSFIEEKDRSKLGNFNLWTLVGENDSTSDRYSGTLAFFNYMKHLNARTKFTTFFKHGHNTQDLLLGVYGPGTTEPVGKLIYGYKTEFAGPDSDPEPDTLKWMFSKSLIGSIAVNDVNKDEVKIYSAPEGVDSSGDFTVSVDGKNAFVFYVSENKHRKTYLPGADITPLGGEKKSKKITSRESWVSFESSTGVPISIQQLADPLPMENVLLIDELGSAIEYTLDNKKISFTAKPGHKYVLILNRDLSRCLTIFAENPEEGVPDMNASSTFVIQPNTPRIDYEKTTKKVLYFAPGLHELGDSFPLKPGLQIYLAPGAYVRGYFTCPPNADSAGASGVKIFGRGILSSEYNQISESVNGNFLPRPIGFWSNSIYLGGFNREPADNQVVEGITIIYPSQQPIMGNGTKTRIENVKVINFEKGFGGICVGSQSIVKDCYISTDNRVLTTFGSDTTFSGNLIIGLDLDTPFYFGDRILDDMKNITVENSTVIGDWKNLIAVNQVHFGNLSNFNFNNIRTIYTGKKSKVSLLGVAVGFSPYRRDNYQGSITDVKVNGIHINALNQSPVIVVGAYGFSEQAAVRNVSVTNIMVNGDAAKLRPEIEQYAFNITIDEKIIEEGKRPIAKEPQRDFPMVMAADNPTKAYPRRDEDGDTYGWNIAHKIAYPNAKQKSDKAFPKTLSAALGNVATGASLKGVKTISAPIGNFLQTYPAVNDPRMHTLHSPDYEVNVTHKSIGATAQNTPVYENIGTLMSTGNRLVNPPPMLTEHFTNFTHRGPVEVTVKMKDRAPAVKDVLIFPSQLNIKPTYAADGRSFTFILPSPHYLAIIVNGDWIRPLFVFGNPPEDPAPDPTDPAVLTIRTTDDFKTLNNRKKLANYRVINFAPGYHNIGLFFPIFSNQTIYIPGGAYVAGTILGINRDKVGNNAYGTKMITQNKGIFNYKAFKLGYQKEDDYVYMERSNKGAREFLGQIENFTIRGRGILSGENMDWFKGQEDVPSYIILVDRNGQNGVLEGLTFTGRHFHSANFFGSPSLLSNVKTLSGFHGNTDASQWGMVRRNLFSIEQDDGTYIKTGLDIDGWFAWQQNNANVFCFTRTMPKDGETLGHSLVRNVTVIDGRYGQYGVSNLASNQYNPMRGGFWLGINHDKKFNNYGYMADIVMQNITFETIVNPLFQFAPMTGSRFSKMIGIEDITFDNIQVPMGQNWKSIFGVRPETPDDFMRRIVIKDLIISEKKILNLEEFARTRSNGRNLDVKIE